jgi:hypothetical protein
VVRVVARLRALARGWLAGRRATRAGLPGPGVPAGRAEEALAAPSAPSATARLAPLARAARAKTRRALAWLAPRIEPALARALEAVLARRPSARVGKLLLAGSLALAGGARVACTTLPPPSEARVAAQLGDAVGGRVEPGDFVWEPRASALEDLVLGRGVLFLASRAGGAARSLSSARARDLGGAHARGGGRAPAHRDPARRRA